MRAAELAEAGMSLDALEAEIELLIPKIRLYGILSKDSSFLGSILQAKPIVSFKNGEVTPVERDRSKSKPLERLVEIVAGEGDMLKVGVIHADDAAAKSEAKELAKRLKVVYPGRNIPVVQTSTFIGAHSGPSFFGICGLLK